MMCIWVCNGLFYLNDMLLLTPDGLLSQTKCNLSYGHAFVIIEKMKLMQSLLWVLISHELGKSETLIELAKLASEECTKYVVWYLIEPAFCGSKLFLHSFYFFRSCRSDRQLAFVMAEVKWADVKVWFYGISVLISDTNNWTSDSLTVGLFIFLFYFAVMCYFSSLQTEKSRSIRVIGEHPKCSATQFQSDFKVYTVFNLCYSKYTWYMLFFKQSSH